MSLVCRCTLAISLVAVSAVGAQAPSGRDTESSDAQDWSFFVTPYLWAAGIDGNTAAQGVGSEIDTGYSFLSLDNLDFALATAFEARKGRWAVLVDGMYVDFNHTRDGALLDADVGLSGGFLETSAAYPAAHIAGLDVVFGMRYVALASSVQPTPGPSAEEGAELARSLVGVRFSHDFNDRWSVVLRGDVGGFGVASDLTTNVSAVFGLRLTDLMTLRFGYRVLQMDFQDDRFVLDATAQGYAFGLTFAL